MGTLENSHRMMNEPMLFQTGTIHGQKCRSVHLLRVCEKVPRLEELVLAWYDASLPLALPMSSRSRLKNQFVVLMPEEANNLFDR